MAYCEMTRRLEVGEKCFMRELARKRARREAAKEALAAIRKTREESEMLSDCCGARALDETQQDKIGICGQCHEWVSFERHEV